MGNTFRVALAATALCALAIGTAVPAGAQEEPEALGFAVDKTQAPPGALVLGKADAADVAEHCVTDLQEFQTRFQELFDEAFDGGSAQGELFDRFFPTGNFDYETHDQAAYGLLGLTILGLIGFTGPEPAEEALPQTFVMTFADITTQDPVGERGNFNPNTGEGSVVVPDIEPGNWAVAAACVGPSFDIDVLEAGIRQGGEFLEEIGAPPNILSPDFEGFVEEFTGLTGFDAVIAFLEEIGPTLLEPIMVPDAFGAVIFCILDDQGNCPGQQPPPPELGPGEVKEMAPPAPAVVAAPSFTG